MNGLSTDRKANRTAHTAGLLVAACFLLPATVFAGGATATALISVRVLGHADAEVAQGAVTVSKVSDLDFGTIPVVTRSRHAVVAPGSANAATYRVGGGYSASFAVSLPQSVVVRNGSSALTVTRFTTAGTEGGRLSDKGTATVGVGASLEVVPDSAPGVYEGTFPLTVAYN
jgi:hypothetical protein